MSLVIRNTVICVLLLSEALAATAAPVLRETPDGLFIDNLPSCVIVENKTIDTMAEALAAGGRSIMRVASWRGREGRYIVAVPAEAIEVRIKALGRNSISLTDIQISNCPESIDIGTAIAMSEASDLRLSAYFGAPSDTFGIETAYSNALAGLPAKTLPGWRADMYFEQAEWRRDSGQPELALNSWANALSLYRKSADARGEAAALNSIGLAHWRQARPAAAASHLEQALAIRQSRGESFATAAILNNLGILGAEIGDQETALFHYQQALSIFQNGIELRTKINQSQVATTANLISPKGDLGSALNTLNNLAQLYRDGGQNSIAQRYWLNYLAFQAFLPDVKAVAEARHNLGVLKYEQGKFDEALRLLLDAKSTFDAADDGRWKAQSRIVLSILYRNLGDDERAWVYAEQALSLQADDRRVQLDALRQGGRIALTLGHAEEAFDAFQEAKELLNDNAPIREIGALESDLARTELSLNQLAAALTRQQKNVQRLEQVEFPAATARARSLLGEILYRQGEIEAAVEALKQAQTVQQRIGAKLAELETLERLGRIQQETDSTAAISTHHRALALLNDPSVRGLPQLHEAGFRARYRKIYERQVALLLDADQLDEAWAVGELARTGDIMVLRDGRKRELQGAALFEALDQHAELLSDLHLLTSKPDSDGQKIQQIRARIDRLEVDLQPTASETQTPSLATTRNTLAPNQRLLSFVLGEDRGWVWIIGGNSSDQVFSIDNVEGLRADVEKLLVQLRHPRNALGRASRLVQSIRNRLPAQVHQAVANADEILIQPDRELHALPFSLLWLETGTTEAPKSFRRILSASTMARPEKPASEPSMLVLADPGWSDPDESDSLYPESSLLGRLLRDSSLARLPGTRTEADAIAALGNNTLRVQLKTGPFASRDFIINGGLHGYSHLHFATHGLVDIEYPELSALLLASESGAGPAFLRPHDISRLNLNAELVVLSGCDTGYGRVFAGSGAFSLARPFLLAGADQVLASLWKVDDHRAAQFMQRFYQYLLVESNKPADALALTKHWMQQQPGNNHPYFWSGFTLSSTQVFD